MVTVRVTETYDLKTSQGKLGLIGVHTPGMALIQRLYPGLIANYKFIRFKRCDVVGASAAALPVDPLQVSYNAGSVAPEDMFNPILMKAVTNDSFETLAARITSASAYTSSDNSINIDTSITGDVFKIYYSLLAGDDGFRKSMPQMGFRLTNLVPLAHTLVSSFGNVNAPQYVSVKEAASDTTHYLNITETEITRPNDALNNNEWLSGSIGSPMTYRGRPVRMPRFPLHTGIVAAQQGAGLTTVARLPRTFVALLVIPPAKLSEFYYRMRVTWTIEFTELITANSYATGANMAVTANYGAYEKLYPDPAVELENTTDSVDTTDVSIEKIMES